MKKGELRCTARHPRDASRECRNLLAVVLPGSVSVAEDGAIGPGCVQLRCDRCGAEYVVCPVKLEDVA